MRISSVILGGRRVSCFDPSGQVNQAKSSAKPSELNLSACISDGLFHDPSAKQPVAQEREQTYPW